MASRKRGETRAKAPRAMRAPRGDAWTQERQGWRCPACDKIFVQRGLSHACIRKSLEDHFRDRPRAFELFEAYRTAFEAAGGPFRLSIAKTRIGFIDRITFAAVMPRKDTVRVHFLLLRKLASRRFARIDHFPPYWVHVLVLRDASDIDEEMRGWLRESYHTAQGR